MTMLRVTATTLAITLLLLAQAAAGGADTLKVSKPWISLPLLDDEPAPVYFSLRNSGKRDRKLVGASCARAERVEIHGSEFVDGSETTAVLKEFEVPGGGAVLFTEGGVFLMLIGPKDLKEGEQIDIELKFGNGEKLRVSALVRDA